MKREIPYWQTVGFIFTGVVGTLLHFLFDWTGESPVTALFCPVNESVWEHLKLLFYPMVLFSLGEWLCWGQKTEGFWHVKLTGILLGISLIVVVYYIYTGALGIRADWLNIALFFLAAGVALWVETKLFQRNFRWKMLGKLPVVWMGLIAVFFTFFTFWPPHAPLFQDPVTGSYGFPHSAPDSWMGKRQSP